MANQPIRPKKSVAVKSLKNSLVNPLDFSWPELDKVSVSLIKQEISRTFAPIELHGKKPRKQEKERDVPTPRSRFTEDQKKHWSLLKFGLRETTKALENDQLCLCLVDRNVKPDLLTKHLISLSVVRQCPAAAIHGLAQFMKPYLGFSPVTVGFKRSEERKTTTFDSLISFIINKVPRIDIPWFNMDEKEHIDSDNSISKDDDDDSETEKQNPAGNDNVVNLIHGHNIIKQEVSEDENMPENTEDKELENQRKETEHFVEKVDASKNIVSKFDPYKLYITKAESTVKPRTNIFSSLSFISLSTSNTETRIKETTSSNNTNVKDGVLGDENEGSNKKLKLGETSDDKQSVSVINKLSHYSPAQLKQIMPRPGKMKKKKNNKRKT